MYVCKLRLVGEAAIMLSLRCSMYLTSRFDDAVRKWHVGLADTEHDAFHSHQQPSPEALQHLCSMPLSSCVRHSHSDGNRDEVPRLRHRPSISFKRKLSFRGPCRIPSVPLRIHLVVRSDASFSCPAAMLDS